MSTHAAIIQQTPAGEFRGIYVHSDGYPEHTGRILAEHYTDERQVDALIGLGDLSSVGATPEECIAYHRDRGELKRIRGSVSLDWLRQQIDASYYYLWTNGEWKTFTSREFYDEAQDWDCAERESKPTEKSVEAELLEALCKLERGIRLWMSQGISDDDMKQAKAAIARAMGGQP